jgi:hypothetical protein
MVKLMPRARSTSLNPVIYPEWWGHEEDIKHGRVKVAKRLKSADPAKAKINRAINRHAEDSLDKRLRNVYDKDSGEKYNTRNRENHST